MRRRGPSRESTAPRRAGLVVAVAAAWLLGCVPAATRRGERALDERRPAEALAAFESVLVDDPSDGRARAGRTKALEALAAEQLAALVEARRAQRFDGALDALTALLDLSRRTGASASGLEAERQALEQAIVAWLREPLTVSQPLEAEARLRALEAPVDRLGRAGLGAVGVEARAATRAVGARRCAVLGGVVKTPWLARFLGGYCDHFDAAGPTVPPMPEQRSSLAFSEAVRGGATLAPALRAGLEATFRSSPWFSEAATSGLPVSVTATIDSDSQRQAVDTFVTWTESETYSTTENVTETYTETYMAYESRPFTRTVTSTESYTYSCGSGTRYQTCSGTRPVTRTVTEYRSEYVSKTRPATRTVTKTGYKTRPVSKRFDFKAVQVSAKHAARVEVSFALPGTATPLTVQLEDQQRGDDLDHDVHHAPAGLVPHRAVVPTVEAFQQRVLGAVRVKAAPALERAWLEAHCRDVETPEAAARCVAAATAPAEAWVALARFTGETPETLRRQFGWGR